MVHVRVGRFEIYLGGREVKGGRSPTCPLLRKYPALNTNNLHKILNVVTVFTCIYTSNRCGRGRG